MNGEIRNIVLGIAALQHEDPHIGHANDLAQALGASLHLVHGYQLPDPSLYPSLQVNVFSPIVIQEIHDRAHQSLEAQVRKLTSSGRIHCHARPGPAALAILDVADDVAADLIIVGATRHGRIARAIIGSTAQRVLRNSPVPVLVARRPGQRIRRILLTTDLSKLSTKVHERGAALAETLAGDGDPLLRSLFVAGYDLPMIVPMEPGGSEKAAERQLVAYLDRLHTSDGRSVEGKVRIGEPAAEILAEAKAWKADLLVLGTHGRGAASRFLIGSVAESVLRRVKCDVLVVPAAAVEDTQTGAAVEDTQTGAAVEDTQTGAVRPARAAGLRTPADDRNTARLTLPYGFGATIAAPYASVLPRVRAALAAEGFGVLTEIDVSATLKHKLDVDFRPYIILGACNPSLAHRALGAELEIGLLLPCNVVVRAADDERMSVVSIMDPEAALSLTRNDTIVPVAADVKARLERVLDAVRDSA